MSTLTEEERRAVGRKPAASQDQKQHGGTGATSDHTATETLQPYKLRNKVIEFGEEAMKGIIIIIKNKHANFSSTVAVCPQFSRLGVRPCPHSWRCTRIGCSKLSTP